VAAVWVEVAVKDHKSLDNAIKLLERWKTQVVLVPGVRSPQNPSFGNRVLLPVSSEMEVIVTAKDTFYLEARSRTQDLLSLKWMLRAAGYRIGSTWHEGEASSSLGVETHWNAKRIEQLQRCDALAVICGRGEESPLQVAVLAGFAVARGLSVIWIGDRVQIMSHFETVQQFNTAEDFRKQLLLQVDLRFMCAKQRQLAA
jgi:hypothetical protein